MHQQFRSNFSFRRRPSDERQQAQANPGSLPQHYGSRDNLQHAVSEEYDEELLGASTSGVTNRRRDASVSVRDTGGNNVQQGRHSDADPGPLGLNVVYSPEGGKHRADIVFVHGLGGTSRLTWSKHKNPDLFWPLHFLPLEPDVSQARILTFGYNANFQRRARVSVSVLDFAKDLLFDLKYAKDRGKGELDIGSVSQVHTSKAGWNGKTDC